MIRIGHNHLDSTCSRTLDPWVVVVAVAMVVATVVSNSERALDNLSNHCSRSNHISQTIWVVHGCTIAHTLSGMGNHCNLRTSTRHRCPSNHCSDRGNLCRSFEWALALALGEALDEDLVRMALV